MDNTSTAVAGIDIGKHALDLALNGQPERWRFDNTETGRRELLAELSRHGVARVGLEASGGYERPVVKALREVGLDVILFQPRQVRAYAVYRLRRAKTDSIDAGLIATCAAAHGPGRAPPDPRLAAMAEALRLVDQIGEDIARAKTRLEAFEDPRLRARHEAEISRLQAEQREEIKRLRQELKQHPDLMRRLALITSVPGIGEKTGLVLLIRMPELGSLTREQAASLVGLAPFDHSSGQHKGQRRIAGGRATVRTALYAAAFPAANTWNPALVALYKRLKERGKPHTLALVACARKLLIFANAVVQNGTPWKAA
jgi:transposase